MNRETFKELIGENPEDVMGMDWANQVADWDEEDEDEDEDEDNEPLDGDEDGSGVDYRSL